MLIVFFHAFEHVSSQKQNICFEIESGVLYVSSDRVYKMPVFCLCAGKRNLGAFLDNIIAADLVKSQICIHYNSPW